MELSNRLQKYGDSVTGLNQYAIKKFGEAFEIVPRTLAENAGMDVKYFFFPTSLLFPLLPFLFFR